MTTTSRPPALIGELSLTTADGTTLTSRTDVALAEQWAIHEHGEAWSTMNATEQARETGAALAGLRRTAQQGADQ